MRTTTTFWTLMSILVIAAIASAQPGRAHPLFGPVRGLSIDAQDHIWIAIWIAQDSSTITEDIKGAAADAGNGRITDSRGNLYVTEIREGNIQKFVLKNSTGN